MEFTKQLLLTDEPARANVSRFKYVYFVFSQICVVYTVLHFLNLNLYIPMFSSQATHSAPKDMGYAPIKFHEMKEYLRKSNLKFIYSVTERQPIEAYISIYDSQNEYVAAQVESFFKDIINSNRDAGSNYIGAFHIMMIVDGNGKTMPFNNIPFRELPIKVIWD